MPQTITKKKNWITSNPEFWSASLTVLLLIMVSALVSNHKLILNVCTVLSVFWLLKSLKDFKKATSVPDTAEGLPANAPWKGLGREPKWEGTISPVTDYVNPRYVYGDGAESETPMQNHGRVIGYRIGPALVIHSQVGYGSRWSEHHIGAFMDCFGGRLLTKDEAEVLRKNWDTVSKMRKKIGDAPLPKPFFWRVDRQGYAVATSWDEDLMEYNPSRCSIILKR